MKACLDRIYRLGEKPCWYKRPCDGCPDYVSMGTGILIIKRAAIGDVVRMASLVAELKKEINKSPYHLDYRHRGGDARETGRFTAPRLPVVTKRPEEKQPIVPQNEGSGKITQWRPVSIGSSLWTRRSSFR